MMSPASPRLAVARPSASSSLPDREDVVALHMRQHEVLLMAHPDLVEAVALGEIGH